MVLQEAIVNMIEVDDQRLEDTTWTTIKYKNNSICTQYILYSCAFLQKYLNKWKILISSLLLASCKYRKRAMINSGYKSKIDVWVLKLKNAHNF